ncbi:MAG: hypothetical protein U9Q84_01810, partial [Thermodesulfobacteriota bacterium]|nr:hypothetical protein [Thermodesulfobacteriota bacterium]
FENVFHLFSFFMEKILARLFTCLVLLLVLNSQALAHTLYMTVEDNEDGTVTVQGMFSTGTIAASVEVRLEDEKGKVLWKGKTDENGECTFKKPNVPYSIIMDFGPGPGHQAREEGP